MGQAEYLDWCAYFRVEGWPEWRADLRTADLLALLANVNRDPKKRAAAYVPGDFVREWWDERVVVEQKPESLLEKFKALTQPREGRG